MGAEFSTPIIIPFACFGLFAPGKRKSLTASLPYANKAAAGFPLTYPPF